MDAYSKIKDHLGPGIPLLVHNERKAADGSPVYKACKTKVQFDIAKQHGFVEAAAAPVMSIDEPEETPRPEPKPAPKKRTRKTKSK